MQDHRAALSAELCEDCSFVPAQRIAAAHRAAMPSTVSKSDPFLTSLGRMLKRWSLTLFDTKQDSDTTFQYIGLVISRIFAFFNDERPHQGLASRTPDAVYKSAEGGGAMVVDKYAAVVELPIPLRSTETAFDEDSMEIPAIPNTKTGAAPSSCMGIECSFN